MNDVVFLSFYYKMLIIETDDFCYNIFPTSLHLNQFWYLKISKSLTMFFNKKKYDNILLFPKKCVLKYFNITMCFWYTVPSTIEESDVYRLKTK